MPAHVSYQLSPLQQGMLYHALAEPHGGVDMEQLVITLEEPVDLTRMQAAWDAAVARHEILRTDFHWDGAEPLQTVHSQVVVPITAEIRDFTPEEWAQWRQEDRQRGFAMDAAPLLRLHLFHSSSGISRLVWTFHHALLDGRSILQVVEDVFSVYDGHPSTERGGSTTFRDFIAWHQSQDWAKAEKYWRSRLKGFRAPTPLPIEGLGDLTPERMQGDEERLLSVEQTQRLRTLADEAEVTLNTLLQAAWALLLHRYSGETDVCFGATRAGRHGTIDGSSEITGLLINTVPVRVEVTEETTLLQLLQSLRSDWVAMRPHEQAPLARIQAWSDVPAGQSLFHTLIVFENYDLQQHFRHLVGGPWAQRKLRLHEQTIFPLCLAAYAGEGLRLVAEYDRSRLDPALVRALLGHLEHLLVSLPGRLHHPVHELALQPSVSSLTESAPQEFPVDTTLHARFAQQAALRPDAIALVQGDIRLTYAELEGRANAVAAHLHTVGVKRESMVGLCLERTPELVIALLGILKANAAYLPIDLAYPPERLSFMLADAQAPVLLTQRHLATRIPDGHGARVVFIEDIDRGGEAPADLGDPDQLCYVLYTSGSTGQPKGCCITHRNVARLFAATDEWFHFDHRDTWTLFHSTAFDFSVWEIWGALLYGGTLVVVPFEVSRSPEQFRAWLSQEKVTVLNQTPSAFRQLITADTQDQSPLALRWVIFGGEALEMRSLEPWFQRHGDVQPQLVNMYGITETTVHVTYRPLSRSDLTRGSVIGVPIPDLELLVLDGQLRPVPVGIAGELFVGGAGLARGYHERPELTASRFIPHPQRSGERLYRTGDLARTLPDGELEYLGRIDQQVKIRGFRIELGEIESVLLRHPGVREAVVLPRDDGHGAKKLVAWIVEAGQPETSLGTVLRAHLKQFIPDYMIPAAFIRVDRLPLTNNGKLDAKALPEPVTERSAATVWIAPKSEAEQKLAAIWQRVLKVPRVGTQDNFFELGGDSILTILVVSQARQQGLDFTPRHIFEHPTIGALARVASGSSADRREDVPATGSIPLSPIQQWFFAQGFAEPAHWNQSLTLHLQRDFTAVEIEAAMQQLVSAHPVFALTFSPVNGMWEQTAATRDPVISHTIAVDDPSQLQRSLSLTGPLLRYHYAPPERRLSIAIHHLIVDGVSWRILLTDLEAALNHQPLPRRSNSFLTWAAELARAQFPATDRTYWASLPSPEPLPRASTAEENLEGRAQTLVTRLDPGLTEIIRRDLPTQEALLAALAHALPSLTGRSEHLIELEGHGREEALLQPLTGSEAPLDLSHTVGWFTTIFPVRLQALGDAITTLRQTGETLARVPLRGVGALLAPERPRAEILFNYLGQFDHTTEGLELFRLVDFRTDDWHGPGNRRTHLLEINCLILDSALEVRVTYLPSLHREAAITSFAQAFQATLEDLAASPARFSLAGLDSLQLRKIAARHPSLEDLYPLSPMQRLFFSLEQARPGSGSDQWHLELHGPISEAALRQAWNQLIDRQATLRSAYLADDLPEPVQAVLKSAEPVWHVEDLRSMAAAEQQRIIRSYLARDAVQPFALDRPPLTRLALFRLEEERQALVWTHHHLEIDGWSWPLVFAELHALLLEAPLPRPVRYRDYIRWLRQQPEDAPFWRQHLRGFRTPTALPLRRMPGAEAGESHHALTAAETTALHTAARELQVTVNTLVQAAWAILLSQRSGQPEVVFGASFSGRPPEVEGSDRMIGHFVNNLPIRARLTGGDSLAMLATHLHRQLGELGAHQHTPLPVVEACSELAWSARLFNNLVVFQNYLGTEPRLGATRVEIRHAPVRTNYPLTLVVTPGAALTLTWVVQAGVASPAALASLAEQFLGLLRALPTASTVEALASRLPAPPSSLAAGSTPPTTQRQQAATTLERTIGEIWREAFGREVSVDENFFDLGGHSLLMLRVHARLATQLGREVPVVKLFQHPTIRALAQALGDTEPTGPSSAITAAQDRAAKARAAQARRSPIPRSV